MPPDNADDGFPAIAPSGEDVAFVVGEEEVIDISLVASADVVVLDEVVVVVELVEDRLDVFVDTLVSVDSLVCVDTLVRLVVVDLKVVEAIVLANNASLRLLAVSGEVSWYGFWKVVRQISFWPSSVVHFSYLELQHHPVSISKAPAKESHSLTIFIDCSYAQ